MNIGLEHLKVARPKRSIRIPSLEAVFADYQAFEEFSAASERMFDFGKQLHVTLNNILSLGVVAKRYRSQEALNVLNALTHDDFNGRLSVETLKETAMNAIKAIKRFFIKIKDWLVGFGKKVANFVRSSLLGVAKKAVELRSRRANFKPFQYKGIDVVNLTPFNGVVTSVKSINTNADLDDTAIANIGENITKLVSDHQVTSAEEATKVYEGAKELGKAAIALLKEANTAYDNSVKKAQEAERNEKVEEAVNARKRLGNACGAINKLVSASLRTLASIALSRGIKQEGEKKEAPATAPAALPAAK